MTIDDVDVIFHQANKFILDGIQRKLKIPECKMHRSYETMEIPSHQQSQLN